MNVSLLTYTPAPLRVLFTAARTCYSSSLAGDIWETGDGYDEAKMAGVVRGCIKRGHNSVIRHVSFTFAIDGISRACANQLTRHGPGWAFDQQSLRYVKLDTEPEWVLPAGLSEHQRTHMSEDLSLAYRHYRANLDDGVPAEDARAVLPLCTPTNLVATANLAALMHFYGVRFKGTTGRPQDEIKDLAGRMLRLVVQTLPWLGEFFPEIQ